MASLADRRRRRHRALKLAMRGLGMAGVVYLAAVLSLQRRFLFPRPPPETELERPADARQVWLALPFGRVEAWYLDAVDGPPMRRPVILYFHGNAELIDHSYDKFDEARRAGLGVLLVEYPGYGRSEGSPSQSTIADTSLAAFDWARSESSVDPRKIVVFGRSMGGAAAAIAAAQRPVAALILESTFTDLRSFARDFGVPESLVLDPFDNVRQISAYRGPILLFHGDRDQLIPFSQGETLARASQRAQLERLPCGHNDCFVPWSRVHEFLTRHKLSPL